MVPTAAMLDLLFIQISPIHLLLCIIYIHLNSLKNKEFISKAIGLNISIGLKDWNQNHIIQQFKIAIKTYHCITYRNYYPVNNILCA